MPMLSTEESPTEVELKIDSHPANLAPVRLAVEALAGRCGFDEKSQGEIGLCVNEALANVMRHAYDGAADKPIVVSARCDAQAVHIAIRDWGNGKDPQTFPSAQHDPLTPGGLGLICMRQLMDEVRYLPQSAGMLLTMIRRKVRT